MTYAMFIKGGELIAAASVAQKYHGATNHLLVEVQPSGYKLVATDGYSMVIIEREQTINADDKFLLPKEVTRGLKASDTVHLNVDDGKITVHVYDRSFDEIASAEYDHGNAERYPRYDRLITTAHNTTGDNAAINGDYLSNMTKAAKAVFGRNATINVICHGNQPMEFTAHNDDTWFTGFIAPLVNHAA